jgi:hypothetical protein
MGAKHTPGPWKTAATDDSLIVAGRTKIASTYEVNDDVWGEANARLIASAPDLLEVARRELIRAESDLENEVQLCAQWDEDPEEDVAVAELRSRRDFIAAAIARATGEAA